MRLDGIAYSWRLSTTTLHTAALESLQLLLKVPPSLLAKLGLSGPRQRKRFMEASSL